MATKPKEEKVATRVLLVVRDGKEMKITVPAKARITFGPFSPPSNKFGYDRTPGGAVGTLRIYEGTTIVAMWTGVSCFQDVNMQVQELLVVEEGSRVWRNQSDGSYEVTEKVERSRKPALAPAWEEDEVVE